MCMLCARNRSKCDVCINSLHITPSQWGWYCCHCSHLIEKETEAQSPRKSVKITELASSRVRTRTWAACSEHYHTASLCKRKWNIRRESSSWEATLRNSYPRNVIEAKKCIHIILIVHYIEVYNYVFIIIEIISELYTHREQGRSYKDNTIPRESWA